MHMLPVCILTHSQFFHVSSYSSSETLVFIDVSEFSFSLDINELFHAEFVDLVRVIGHAVEVEHFASSLAQVLFLGVCDGLLEHGEDLLTLSLGLLSCLRVL